MEERFWQGGAELGGEEGVDNQNESDTLRNPLGVVDQVVQPYIRTDDFVH